MPDTQFTTICFHDKSKSKIEWLREKLVQTIGLNPEYPHHKVSLNDVSQFMDIDVKTDRNNYLNAISDVKEVKDGYALYLYIESVENHDTFYWDELSIALDIDYVSLQRNS